MTNTDTKTIPNEWRETTLGEVVGIIDGDRGVNYPNEFSRGGYCLFLNTKNVPNTEFSFNEMAFISREQDEKMGKGRLKRGDIVLTTRGTVGNFALYSDKITFENIRINSGMVILRVDEEILENQYFKFYLRSPLFRRQIVQLTSGSAQPQLPIRDLSSFVIYFPEDIEEQEEISSVLLSLDDKIELLREENKTLETIAQTMFKEWFVNFNFPNDDGEPYKTSGGKMTDSELGEIPERWRVSGLSGIAHFLNGLALQNFPPESNTEYLPVIKIKELNTGITEQTDKASARLDKKYVVEDGDILFSWSGSLIVDIWKYGKGVLNQHLFKVTSDEFPKWFYFYWIKEHLPSFQQTATAKAVTMGHIQRHHLDDALVVIPDSDFMKTADAVFSPVLTKFINNNAEMQTLSASRDALLPKLMKGEMRVKI